MLIPFKSTLRTGLRLLIFACALLLGIQVPAFVEQYSQRVDAHYREVSANISGFQQTAALLFDGDLNALIEYYQSSGDQVFERDARSIQTIVDRYDRIAREQATMQGDAVAVAWHVVVAADRELFDEALQQYSYTVPLNGIALQWGFALAIIFMLTGDLCIFSCASCVRLMRRRKQGLQG